MAAESLGLVGRSGCFVLVFVHRCRAQRGTFVAVLLLALVVVAVELAYFERDVIEAEIPGVDAGAEARFVPGGRKDRRWRQRCPQPPDFEATVADGTTGT